MEKHMQHHPDAHEEYDVGADRESVLHDDPYDEPKSDPEFSEEDDFDKTHWWDRILAWDWRGAQRQMPLIHLGLLGFVVCWGFWLSYQISATDTYLQNHQRYVAQFVKAEQSQPDDIQLSERIEHLQREQETMQMKVLQHVAELESNQQKLGTLIQALSNENETQSIIDAIEALPSKLPKPESMATPSTPVTPVKTESEPEQKPKLSQTLTHNEAYHIRGLVPGGALIQMPDKSFFIAKVGEESPLGEVTLVTPKRVVIDNIVIT